jgi:hypothetical protein
LVNDPEIRPILISKFERLSRLRADQFQFTVDELEPIDNPLPFPHNDSEIHYHQLFVGARSGLFSTATGNWEKGERNRIKLTDAPSMDIAAKFQSVVVAAGADGLIEVHIPSRRQQFRSAPEIRNLANRSCVSCEWAYESVIASDQEGSSFLASFSRIQEPTGSSRRTKQIRRFDRVVEDTELFPGVGGHTELTWGARDKFYRYQHGHIDVVRYKPGSTKREAEFSPLGELQIQADVNGEKVVAARVAPFGSVIERDRSLLVVPSSGDPFVISGEPVNWRVFPRSTHYINHLHVIHDDRLEIWAFTHDYFADQTSKLAGIGVGSDD